MRSLKRNDSSLKDPLQTEHTAQIAGGFTIDILIKEIRPFISFYIITLSENLTELLKIFSILAYYQVLRLMLSDLMLTG